MKKINWKAIAATLVRRISKCWDKTEPANYVMLIAGIVLGFITVLFPIMGAYNQPSPSLFAFLAKSIWRAFWLTAVLEGILYGMWELVQGIKWIGRWAERVQYEKNQEA